MGIRFLAFAMLACAPAHADDESAFVARYACWVEATIAANHARPIVNDVEYDRYFILLPLDGRKGFSQCIFVDRDSNFLCEVASGFYGRREGEPQAHLVTGQRLAAIVRLGFSSDDSKGNFQALTPVSGPQDFARFADLALRAMYEAFYGERGLDIRIVSPRVDVEALRRDCAPVS